MKENRVDDRSSARTPGSVPVGLRAFSVVTASLVAVFGLIVIPAFLAILGATSTSEFFGEDYFQASVWLDRAFVSQVVSTGVLIVGTVTAWALRYRFWTGLGLSVTALAVIAISALARALFDSTWSSY